MRLPHLDLPALALCGGHAVEAGPSGEPRLLSPSEARARLASGDVLVCHASFVAERLKAPLVSAVFDVLELFAFVCPAEPCLPSPLGLVRALGLKEPQTPEGLAKALPACAEALFSRLRGFSPKAKEPARNAARFMAKAGWRWGPAVLSVLGAPLTADPGGGLDSWGRLSPWEDHPPEGAPTNHPVRPEEAVARLISVLGKGAEPRPQQRAFAAAATTAFAPRLRAGSPRVALVEAGTGTGKTLGYLAAASLWAQRNGPGLWISTYTRNLQRQILQEIGRIYPGASGRAVLRKGRENYLCLLNVEEAMKRSAPQPKQRAVAVGLIARFIEATADGDVSGEGFPSFLAGHLPLRELTDRRGECIYAACPHWKCCFIEKAVRRARHAEIVVANHALVMAQATRQGLPGNEAHGTFERAFRYVFDEGHHLFDAADSAFAESLSGNEMAELRRWVRGPEGRRIGRGRGLGERTRDLIGEDSEAARTLEEALAAAGALASDGWHQRVRSGAARGPGEMFLAEVYQHVLARSPDADASYGLEAGTEALSPALVDAARVLDRCLLRLIAPLVRLSARLRSRLDAEAASLDSDLRGRIEAAARGIDHRAQGILAAWRSMLAELDGHTGAEQHFAEWFEIVREDGRDVDVGLSRHWIDPTIPFADAVLRSAHGALITSATLRDGGGSASDDFDWRNAEMRVGAHHLPEPPVRALFGSPFDFGSQCRIFIVKDIPRRDIAALAAAYRELFLAAGGGALGLFTSVRVLKGVHARIAPPLAEAGLSLYAQHIDRLDTGTLVDLFRAEKDACLLGTDALRDGVDVKGRSLRLCVFDKVPWPKPTILHKARRAHFGKAYDDQLVRLRLKQAFGRLIRSQSDKGVFVILDAAVPSRLLQGLPPEAPVIRTGLADAVAQTRSFLAPDPCLQTTVAGQPEPQP